METNKITFDLLPTHISKIDNYNIILIHGPEAFQKNESLSLILKKLDCLEIDQFDSFLVYGDDYSSKSTSINSILEQLFMSPFILKKKIIIIKNFDEMCAENQENVSRYCGKNLYENILILTSDKLETRTNRIKKIVSSSFCIECKELRYPNILMKYINDELKKRQLKMDEKCKQTFINSIDLDYYTAYNELNKLEIYIGTSKIISEKDVINCTAYSKSFSVFELLDEIGYKNLEKAILISENILNANESAILIITLLTNFFFSLWKLSALKAKNLSNSELKERYMNDISIYFRDKYFIFLKNYKLAQIRDVLKLLLECDRQLKLTMANDNVLIQTLIIKIIRNGKS